MNIKSILSLPAVAAGLLLVASCGQPVEDQAPLEVDLAAHAINLARESIIIDTHIDVPNRVFSSHEDVTQSTMEGNFDYPRAVAGGLNAAFMSVYIPAAMEEEGTATAHADALIDLVEGIALAAPDKFAVATSVADVEEQFAAGLVSLSMGMENGAPIAGSLDNLQHFYGRGIRYITLTHSLSNHIADSSYDDNKRWGGLSPFGEELVAAMNNIGVMVDISHVSDEAFWDVIAITKTPVIASHSSARHFTPGFERNMNDDMIKALAENGGVIQINFGSSFLTERANGYRDVVSAAIDARIAQEGLEDVSDDQRSEMSEAYREEFGYPYATLDETLDHFDHVIDLVGIDHVGIGSDYDGVGDSLPIGLKDVSAYPVLIEGLLRRGYSDDEIKKILGGNLLRVWSGVEAYARAQANAG
jgi:membrane dipeptidase